MSYCPADLDELITISKPIYSDDGYGGQDVTWQVIENGKDVWAKAVALSGGESSDHNKVNDTHNYRFVVRNRDDLDETMKITWDGDDYNIRSIPKVSRRAMYLEVEAERGVAL